MPTYQIEIMWNREFHFRPHGQLWTDLERCIAQVQWLESAGDGCAVKNSRIVEPETGRVVWQYGEKVPQ